MRHVFLYIVILLALVAPHLSKACDHSALCSSLKRDPQQDWSRPVPVPMQSSKIALTDRPSGSIIIARTLIYRHRRPRPDPPAPDQQGFCMVTVFRQLCHVVSNNPRMEVCYWLPEHVQGVWNERGKCCEVWVDGFTYCVRDGAIYRPGPGF